MLHGSALIFTQAGPLRRRGHPANKKKRARVCSCLLLDPSEPLLSHAAGRFQGGHPAKNNTLGAFIVFSPRLLTRGDAFSCCSASRNRSLTHAAGAVGTPRPPSKPKKKHAGALIFCLLRGPVEQLKLSPTEPKNT